MKPPVLVYGKEQRKRPWWRREMTIPQYRAFIFCVGIAVAGIACGLGLLGRHAQRSDKPTTRPVYRNLQEPKMLLLRKDEPKMLLLEKEEPQILLLPEGEPTTQRTQP